MCSSGWQDDNLRAQILIEANSLLYTAYLNSVKTLSRAEEIFLVVWHEKCSSKFYIKIYGLSTGQDRALMIV